MNDVPDGPAEEIARCRQLAAVWQQAATDGAAPRVQRERMLAVAQAYLAVARALEALENAT